MSLCDFGSWRHSTWMTIFMQQQTMSWPSSSLRNRMNLRRFQSLLKTKPSMYHKRHDRSHAYTVSVHRGAITDTSWLRGLCWTWSINTVPVSCDMTSGTLSQELCERRSWTFRSVSRRFRRVPLIDTSVWLAEVLKSNHSTLSRYFFYLKCIYAVYIVVCCFHSGK